MSKDGGAWDPGVGTAGRGVRLVLMATVLAALLVQGVAAVAIPRDMNQLVQRARQVQAQLDEQYAAIERLTEQLNETTDRQAGLRRQHAALVGRQRQVQAQLAKAQQRLDEQARAAYMAGPGNLVSEFVGSPDLAEALNRVPLQRSVLEAQVAVLDEVRKAKSDLDSVKAQIDAALAAQQQTADSITAQRARIKTLVDQLQATLAGMDRELAGALSAAQRLDESARRAAFAAFASGAGGRGALGGLYFQPAAAAQRAVQYALAQLGDAYLWGATGPDRFDCSGLTMSAYRAAGVSIPRVSWAQWGAGRYLDVGSLLPGDLVFYADDVSDPSSIHHVGMYVGRGLMVHAPHTGAVVSIASIWRSGYIGAVRIVPAVPKSGVTPPPTIIGPPGTVPPPPPPSMTTRPPTTTAPPTTASTTTTPPKTTVPSTTTAPTTTQAPTTTAPTTTAASTTSSAAAAVAGPAATASP